MNNDSYSKRHQATENRSFAMLQPTLRIARSLPPWLRRQLPTLDAGIVRAFFKFRLPHAILAYFLELGAYLAVFGVVVAALLWPSPIKSDMLPGSFSMSDLLISHWPSAGVIKETVASGHGLPFWNPIFGGGRPLAADPLAALWYPPTHLVHLFDLRTHFFVLLAGHLVFAGLGAAILGRMVLRLSPVAGLITGLTFMATPRLIAHLGAGHVTMVQTAAWLPWVALTSWATVHAPHRWAVAFAGSFAMLLLAGHPQLAYYGSLMIVGIVLWQLVQRRQTAGWRGVLTPIAGLGLGGLLAGMLAAGHLLPLLEFAAHSTRQYSVRTTDALGVFPFLQALVGLRHASPVPHEALFDPGLAVLALAVLGIAIRPRTGVPLLLGVSLIAALALGVSSPVYQLVAWLLPGFDGFRGLGRIWFIGLLGIALLAGLGTEALVVALRGSRQLGFVPAGIAGVVFLSLSLVQASQGFAHVANVKTQIQPRRIDQEAAKLAGSRRIYGVQRNMSQIVAAQLHVQLADGWDPLLIEPYVRFMQRAGGYTFEGYQLSVPPYEVYDPGYPTSRAAQPKAALLGLVNIEAVLSRTPLYDPDLIRVAYRNNTFLYRNRANEGPAYLVADTTNGMPPMVDQLKRVAATVDVQEQQAERLTVRVMTTTGGWLVVGAPAFPGWVARLDGNVVPLRSIEGVLPTVHIEPGNHHLTYEYAPGTVHTGVMLATCGLLMTAGWVIGFCVFGYVHRRRLSAGGGASGNRPGGLQSV